MLGRTRELQGLAMVVSLLGHVNDLDDLGYTMLQTILGYFWETSIWQIYDDLRRRCSSVDVASIDFQVQFGDVLNSLGSCKRHWQRTPG